MKKFIYYLFLPFFLIATSSVVYVVFFDDLRMEDAGREAAVAEHEIYQKDVDIAVKKNLKTYLAALKKDVIERGKTQDNKSVAWHIAHKGVDKFKKSLVAYEVDGLSLGMKISALEKTLVSNGYQRHSREIEYGSPKYIYRKGKGNNTQSVEISAAESVDIPNIIIADLQNSGGDKKIAKEKIRLLNAFSGTCQVSTSSIYCFKYTDTNEVSISVKFPQKSSSNIQYHIKNVPSSRAY